MAKPKMVRIPYTHKMVRADRLEEEVEVYNRDTLHKSQMMEINKKLHTIICELGNLRRELAVREIVNRNPRRKNISADIIKRLTEGNGA